MPALPTAAGEIWSMKNGRLLLDEERLEVHGIASPTLVSESEQTPMGIQLVWDQLKRNQRRALIGNSMAMTQFMSTALFGMTTSRRRVTPLPIELGPEVEASSNCQDKL